MVDLEYHPDKKNFRYGTRSMSPSDTRMPLQNRPRAKSSDFPILIPTVQAYLTALFDQLREYEKCVGLRREICLTACWNVKRLIRYLYFDRPHQRALILSRLYGRNRRAIEDRLDRYRRIFPLTIDPKIQQTRKKILWVTAYPEGQDL